MECLVDQAAERGVQWTFWLKYMAPQITTTQIESMKPMARAAPIALSSLTDVFCRTLAPSYAKSFGCAMSPGRQTPGGGLA
jgi:hypothetical protein